MTPLTNRQEPTRAWRFLSNVYDVAIIAGTCYVTVRLLMLWTQEFANAGALRSFIP